MTPLEARRTAFASAQGALQTFGFAASLGEIGPVHGKLKRLCVGLAAVARIVAGLMAGTVMRDQHWSHLFFLVSSSCA
jgi:hypothetical protein